MIYEVMDAVQEGEKTPAFSCSCLRAVRIPAAFRRGRKHCSPFRSDGPEKECVSMQTTITAKLKLTTTPAQFAALRQTQLAFRDALNRTSLHAFAHGKTSNSQRLHRDLYDEVRTTYGLPSQMACSVFRQVGATYKALWTKAKKHAEARRLGSTKKRFKGLDKAPRYVSPTLTYVYGHDYSLRCEQAVSLLTLAGRLHVPYRGYSKHVALMQHGASIGGAKLWYDQSRKRFYLLVSLTIERLIRRQQAKRR